MWKKIIFVLTFLVTFGIAQEAQHGPLVRSIELDRKTELTAALGQLGIHVESGHVSFGVDLEVQREQPMVTLYLRSGDSLTTGLQQIVGQIPGYTFRRVSEHVVNIYKAGSEGDPENILNLRIAKFEVRNEPPANILANPGRFMPELKRRLEPPTAHPACGVLGPGLGSPGPGITLTMENASVRDILNAVAEASSALAVAQPDSASTVPVGWVHIARRENLQTQTLHEWRFYSTVGKGWRTNK